MDYEIKTKKSKSEIMKIIIENTNEVYKGDLCGGKYFGGKITNNTFKLWKFFTFNRFFSPIIIGTVEESKKGSTIKLNCKYRLIDRIIIFIWLSLSGVACIVLPFLKPSLSVPIYSPYIVFIAGIIISIIPYRIELELVMSKLGEILRD